MTDLIVNTVKGIRCLNLSCYKGRVVIDVRKRVLGSADFVPAGELVLSVAEWNRLIKWGLDFDLALEVALEDGGGDGNL